MPSEILTALDIKITKNIKIGTIQAPTKKFPTTGSHIEDTPKR